MSGNYRTPHEFTGELKDRYGLTRDDLTALTTANDPFNSGSAGDVKLARWFADLYEQLGQPRVHLRDLHYMVVVRGLAREHGPIYTGTNSDWVQFLKAAKKARDLGLVSPWAFVDKRTQAEYAYDEERSGADEPWIEPGLDLLTRPELRVPAWSVVPPSLADVPTSLSLQPVVAEVCIEKDSQLLNSEVLPICRSLGCRVVIGAGNQSKTFAADLVRRAISDGRDRVVFWLGDADAKGESMAAATARHIEYLCRWWLPRYEPETDVPRILLDQVALTLDQVADVQREIGREIPLTPDEGREEGRVELQALAVFAPGWIEEELQRRLVEVTDSEIADELAVWETEAERVIEETWREEIGPSEEKVTVVAARRDEILGSGLDLAALDAALDKIEPERERLEAEIQEIIDGFEPDLPTLPEGYIELDDSRDWLLDTERDYEEQLNAYRRHEPIHRRRPELDFAEPVCEECGDPLPPRKKRHCSEACRKRSDRRVSEVPE